MAENGKQSVAGSGARRDDRPGAFAVLRVFLGLGVTSFGGPAAHIGYFRKAFVEERRWLDDTEFAALLALCQFLPGPASSQLGFAIGLHRAGVRGALAAWTGFTLPSALLMVGAAWGLVLLESSWLGGLVAGLKIAAVAVVLDALIGMTASLASGPRRAAIAAIAAGVLLVAGVPVMQIAVIALAALAGLWLLRTPGPNHESPVRLRWPRPLHGKRAALILFSTALIPLIALPLLQSGTGGTALGTIDALYRAGALVFGGGHVVLPLLEASLVPQGLLERETFLAGYGAVQAVPGPLFTIGAFVGAAAGLEAGFAPLSAPGLAVLGLVAIFLPGMLFLLAALPVWSSISASPRAQAAIKGANAAVVGVLAAAFIDPVVMSALSGWPSVALALIAFVALRWGRVPPWAVVVFCASAGAVLFS